MASKKTIEEQIRDRFLEAVEELKLAGFTGNRLDDVSYKDIFESIGEFPQAHRQMKTGTRYPTLANIVRMSQEHGYRIEWLMLGLPPKRNKIVKSRTLEDRLSAVQEEFLQIISEVRTKRSNTK